MPTSHGPSISISLVSKTMRGECKTVLSTLLLEQNRYFISLTITVSCDNIRQQLTSYSGSHVSIIVMTIKFNKVRL